MRPPASRFRLEEPERFLAIADEQVFCLLIVIEHHLVILPPDARLLVAAKSRMRRIRVIAVGPHASRLDLPAEAVRASAVASPHTCAETVQRIVGDFECFFIGLSPRFGSAPDAA